MTENPGLSVLKKLKQDDLVSVAREFVHANVDYSFSLDEQGALRPFFTNLDKRVFLIHSLPSNVQATLSSMFSRLGNKRGIRGVFVDSFLPGLLASNLLVDGESGEEDIDRFVKTNGITSLSHFIIYSHEARLVFERFVSQAPSEAFTQLLSNSRKAKKFLSMWLGEKYGHNSIARMGAVSICFEDISILAAKSIEWTRPGAGYVELSPRFVTRVKAGTYPIERELGLLGITPRFAKDHLGVLFEHYSRNMGENLDGPLPNFLRDRWGDIVSKNGGNVEVGVKGETYDVLSNLLPAATLTSVAILVSGESLPSVLKHLILDDTPENMAIVELVLQEAAKIGDDQFIRHHEPSQVERKSWEYLKTGFFSKIGSAPRMISFGGMPSNRQVQELLLRLFSFREPSISNIKDMANALFGSGRGNYDKLPRDFEIVTVPFAGKMSFRSWRDIQRQGISTHQRTLLTPYLGFFRYDKPCPSGVDASFFFAQRRSGRIYNDYLCSVPPVILQYLLPLGFNIGSLYSANLRQHEFCNWQRTKPSVNNEVRQTFISVEQELRSLYPWWHLFSRADMTRMYVFARGSAIPLP